MIPDGTLLLGQGAASVRAARRDDDASLVAMSLALYAEDPGGRTPSRDEILGTLRHLAENPLRGVAVVMEQEGVTVGYALLIAFWSNELGGLVCIVDELFVQEAARGRGLGSTLVEALAARRLPWFRDAVALELEVTPANARARALYERLGFAAYVNAAMRRVLPASDG